MPPPRIRPEIRIPTPNQRRSFSGSMEDLPLSSLSPASLSTTLSSAAYYSTPQADNSMDLSDEDYESNNDTVVIKSEASPEGHIDGIGGYPDSPLVSSGPVAKRKGRPRKNKVASKELKKSTLNERSKTGCMTCRKRKKKCDETKPMCKQQIGWEFVPVSYLNHHRFELHQDKLQMRRLSRKERVAAIIQQQIGQEVGFSCTR